MYQNITNNVSNQVCKNVLIAINCIMSFELNVEVIKKTYISAILRTCHGYSVKI